MDEQTMLGTEQPATQQPQPAQLYQQALDELGRLTLSLSEQRTALAERERIYRSIGAELDGRRVKLEQDEVTFQRLTGAVQVLQQLVQGSAG